MADNAIMQATHRPLRNFAIEGLGPEVFVVANHQQRLRLFMEVVTLVEINPTFAINHTIGPGQGYQSHLNVYSCRFHGTNLS